MQSIEMFGGGFSLDRKKMDNIEKWLSRPILLKHGELVDSLKIGDLDFESLSTKLYWLGYDRNKDFSNEELIEKTFKLLNSSPTK